MTVTRRTLDTDRTRSGGPIYRPRRVRANRRGGERSAGGVGMASRGGGRAVIAVLGAWLGLATLPPAVACGWWGDAELVDSMDSAALIVGADGKPAPARSARVARLTGVTRMGDRYREGDRLPQSYEEALRLYRLAAEEGFAGAQYNLGLMYEQGLGVSADPAVALRWFRAAAHGGDPSARRHLAEISRDATRR